jgi:hypothetical protein
LLGIEHRGKHATGFVATTFDSKVVLDKAPVKATDFIPTRERIPSGTQAILLHTRFMTQGPVENIINNHPVIYKTCFAIHNGSIRNDDELFKEHELTRSGEVDTEIIPAMLDLHGMDSAANIEKALVELKGAMAIAAIDPVKHPNQLLLARGESSPLHIYHTENYIVWASEGRVIRDAWAKVFGTPPEFSKIGYLGEGKFWIVNGKDVKETTYKIPKTPLWSGRGQGRTLYDKPRNQTRTRTQKNGSRIGNNGRVKPWEGKDSLFITQKNFLDTVKAWREQYEGGDNVRIWAHRDDYTQKDFEDVNDILVWVACLCGEQVLTADTKRHIKYGDICSDCYQVITDKYVGTAKQEDKGEEEAPTVKVHELTPQDRQSLDDWATVDARMNVLCIDEVCELIGFDYNTVEHLVWRMDESALNTEYSRALRKLQADVKKIYKAVEVQMWESRGNEILGIDDEGKPDDTHVAYTVKKGDGVSELWFRCVLHGEDYRSGDECAQCAPSSGRSIPKYACMDCGEYFPRYQVKYIASGSSTASNYLCEECDGWAKDVSGHGGVEVPVENPLALEVALDKIGRCPECNAFKRKDEECRVCEHNLDAIAPGETVAALPEHTGKSCYCNTVKGNPCKRTVKYILGGKGYCYNHFVYCYRRKCDNKANHLLVDGTRVCHKHSRNEKGAKSDRQLGQVGITITEVRDGK